MGGFRKSDFQRKRNQICFQSSFVRQKSDLIQRLTENQMGFPNPESFSRKPSVMSAGTSCIGTKAHRQYEDTRAAEYVVMRSTSSSVHPDSHVVVLGALGECCDHRKAAVWLHRRGCLFAFYQSDTGGSRHRLRASTY